MNDWRSLDGDEETTKHSDDEHFGLGMTTRDKGLAGV